MDALWGLAPWWGTRGSRKSGDCNAIQRRQGDLVPPPARYSGWNCNHRSASLLWEIKRHTQSEMNSLSHSGRICCRFHADKLEQLELDFGILGATRPGTRHSALDFALARRLADALVGSAPPPFQHWNRALAVAPTTRNRTRSRTVVVAGDQPSRPCTAV